MDPVQLKPNANPNLKIAGKKETEPTFLGVGAKKVTLYELDLLHIVPTNREGEGPFISHTALIGSVLGIVDHVFQPKCAHKPNIGVSHPIRGRTREAEGTPADEVPEHQKTIFYNRMACSIPITSVTGEVAGRKVNLVVGGFHAYRLAPDYEHEGREFIQVFCGFVVKDSTQLTITEHETFPVHQLKNVRDLEGRIYNIIARCKSSTLYDLANENTAIK